MATSQNFRIFTLTLLLALAGLLRTQAQTAPVTVTALPGFPPSVYLSDYYAAGSDKLKVNLLLNDFNVESHDVFLRISFESQDVRIRTKTDFIPGAPITLFPGVLVTLSGDDLYPYLNYNNVIIEGISKTVLQSRGGRLPEGFYTICVEVYDFTTQRLLGNIDCKPVQLTMNDPPQLILPTDATIVPPSDNQNITFQWQNNALTDLLTTEYTFRLYELINPQAEPKQAIQNNEVRVVYESEPLTTTMMNYNISHPLLEVGKTYLYTVQATSNDGRLLYKNNGVSETNYFHYGYPEGGKIELTTPLHNDVLPLGPEKPFGWQAPDNLTRGQEYFYVLEIYKDDTLRTPKEIVESDSIFYTTKTGVRMGTGSYLMNVKTYFPTGMNFLWRVSAFTGDQEIATSEIFRVGGPPCIRNFLAADEFIQVKFTTGCDLSNLSGRGEVVVNDSGATQTVVFNHIRIEQDGAQFYLREGLVVGKADSLKYKLTPEFSRNGEAWFMVDSIRLSRWDYEMKGHVEWDFPHAADQEEKPVVYSEEKWMTTENYKLLGKVPIRKSTAFDLLDPYDFTLDFNDESYFMIRWGNQYHFNFQGNVVLPQSIANEEKKAVDYTFSNHNQLYNITLANTGDKAIHIVPKTHINLLPRVFALDLDDEASGAYFSENPAWKGLYIAEAEYQFAGDQKYSGQFGVNDILSQDYNFDANTEEYCYVLSDGITLTSDLDFTDQVYYFNTFPAYINDFALSIDANTVKESHLKGRFKIPFLSETKDFTFTTNISNSGFSTGYLDEKLDGQEFTFNADGGEQKMDLTVHKGYFADNSHLVLNVSLGWNYLNLTFENMAGLLVWGNYDVGFGAPNNGYSLAVQKRTSIKGYELTIDGLGVGRQGSLYSVGSTATMVMGEDVGGQNGPPIVNLYSIYESPLIDEAYVLGNSPDYDNGSVSYGEDGEYSAVGMASNDLDDLESLEEKMDNYKRDLEALDAKADAVLPKKPVGGPRPELEKDKLLDTEGGIEEEVTGIDDVEEVLTIQDLIKLIDIIQPFLEPEQQEKLESLKEIAASLSMEELQALIDKLLDFRSILATLAENKINEQLDKITKPIEEKVDNLNTKIDGFITTKTDSVVGILTDKLANLLDTLSNMAVTQLESSISSDKAQPIIDAIDRTASSLAEAIPGEIRRSVNAAVKKNITNEITGLIDTVFYVNTFEYLQNEITANAVSLVANPDFKLKDIDIDVNAIVENNAKQFEQKLNWDYLGEKIMAAGNDAYAGIRWDSIKTLIFANLLGASVEEFIEQKVEEGVTAAVTAIAGEKAGGVAGSVVGAVAQNVELDFSNLGDKLKSGDLSGIVKFDPSYIIIPTPVADIEGFVKFTEDDPTWGDSWQAKLQATIKLPSKDNPFGAMVQYINGTKPRGGGSESETGSVDPGTFKYWFIEAAVWGIGVPLSPLPFKLDGIDGRIYHHMSENGSSGQFLPDESVRYGAGLGFGFYDMASGGYVVMLDMGLSLELVEGGFIFEFAADAQIANVTVTVKGKKLAERYLAYADGFICYNSVEGHLLAELNAGLNTSPLLCAGGSMVIDISKDWWQIAVGTREVPVEINLLCSDFIKFGGWFDMNTNGLDMGLFALIDINAKGPWIGVTGFKFQPWAKLYFNFGAETVIIWNPTFGVEKAKVWIDLEAAIGVNYEFLIKKGSLTIVGVALGGSLEFATIPDPYLAGTMYGKVTVFGISAGVDLDARIDF